MGGLYIFGAVIYVSRLPEKLYPGKFDIWVHLSFAFINAKFNSHQIFHVLVLSAAIVHYFGCIKSHKFWHTLVNADQNICTKEPLDLISIYLLLTSS
jgi:adiponectin receptor